MKRNKGERRGRKEKEEKGEGQKNLKERNIMRVMEHRNSSIKRVTTDNNSFVAHSFGSFPLNCFELAHFEEVERGMGLGEREGMGVRIERGKEEGWGRGKPSKYDGVCRRSFW